MADKSEALINALLAELGRIVATWNGVEFCLIDLLYAVTGGQMVVKFLATNMRPETICHALTTYASEMLDDPHKDLLLDAAVYFNIVREYRNHYIHTPQSGFGVSENEAFMVGYSAKAKGKSASAKPKGKWTVRREKISLQDLEHTTKLCSELKDYLGHLSQCFRWADVRWARILKAGQPIFYAGKPLSLPQKPQLPDKLEKYLDANQGDPLQPRSPQEKPKK